MAGARKGTGLDTRTARLKLTARHDPYWISVGPGLSLGYRRGAQAGAWYCRRYLGSRRYEYNHLGHADDFSNANGETILTYYQACERVREFATRREQQQGIGVTEEITVGRAAEHYLTWFRAHRKGIETAERIICAFILPAFGDKKVAELKKRTISDWHDSIAMTPARKRTALGGQQAHRPAPQTEDQRRARRATANRILSVLKALLNKAADDGLIQPRGPWIDVKPFRLADQPVVRFLSASEAGRLLSACPDDLRALVRGALLTGCRYSELGATLVRDVTIGDSAARVFVRESKSGKPRFVPLSSEGRDFFAERVQGKPGTDTVFKRREGRPWGRNHAVRPLAQACETANIVPAITFHDLRHTYASLLAQAGADILTISKLLGHADTRITARHYAHLCDQTLANAVESKLPSFGFKREDRVTAVE